MNVPSSVQYIFSTALERAENENQKRSEKHSSADRWNELADHVQPPNKPKKSRQQPGRPAPKPRDLSHLPAHEEIVDIPDEAKVCACCGLPFSDLGCTNDSQQIEMETELYRRV